MKIKKFCLVCQSPFHVFQSEIRKGNGKFCSVPCFRKSQFGRVFSEERRRKIGLAHKGKVIPQEMRERIRLALRGRPNPRAHWKKCKMCDNTFQNAPANAKTLCSKECKREFIKQTQRGENHHNWRKDVTPEYRIKRKRREVAYKEWRMAVLTRYNFTCRMCFKRGGELHADHIKPFSLYPELRLEVSNGQTLCKKCHREKTREDMRLIKTARPMRELTGREVMK